MGSGGSPDGPPAESNAEGKQLASGFLHLMMSQLASRVFSFGLNLFIARKLTPDEFGLAAIQFQLLTSSILFISREGFRRGCLRGDTSSDSAGGGEVGLERVMRVAWLCVPFGVLTTFVSCWAVLLWQSVPLSDPYAQAIILLGFSALLELGSEPLYILAQTLLLLRLRAGIEALASLVRCFVTLALVLLGLGREGGLLFGWAEVGYSGTLFIGYWAYFLTQKQRPQGKHVHGRGNKREEQRQEERKEQSGATQSETKASDDASSPLLSPQVSAAQAPLFPYWHGAKGGKRGPLFDWVLLRLCLAFSLQSLVKLILGKGDEFVLVLLESRFNQGVYGLVSKLGSLVVRCVLQPFEESAFILFAKTAPPISTSPTQPQLAPEEEKRKKTAAGKILLLSLKLVNLLGLVFVVFGPSYSRILLQILYGSTWTATEAPTALACYCLYIMMLALNGTTEAFVHAVMSESQLAASNAWLTLFSLLHMLLSVVLVRAASAPGLILANCCNMAMRIAYCLVFIAAYFKGMPSFSLTSSIPKPGVCLAFLASAMVTHLSNAIASSSSQPPWRDNVESLALRLLLLLPYALHIVVGATCLAGVLLSLFILDRPFLKNISALLPGRPGVHAKEE